MSEILIRGSADPDEVAALLALLSRVRPGLPEPSWRETRRAALRRCGSSRRCA